MRERQKIVELWRRGGAVALVTLVRVEGSSYRKPGARLLIAASGEYAGAVSGGCLETEVLRKTQWKIRDGAVVDRYSTLFDDTADIPYGLGCGGTVDLLLERADTAEFAAMMQALAASVDGEEQRVVTQLPVGGATFARFVGEGESGFVGEVFEERLRPTQRLILFGAGDDAQPMVQAAAILGWRVFVVDGRAQWAKAERFPEAERVALDAQGIEIGRRDAVVVMTHSYEQDREWLMRALPGRPRYLGLLGAKHRSALLLSEAAAMLGWDLERVCERVFAPIGLDLGGEGAEAIAFATIAEILACYEGKLKDGPRMTAEVVREQVAMGGASKYLQTQCAL